MSVTLPTTQQVSDLIVAQISASIAQTIPLLPKAFVRVLAKVLAGVVVILYKYQGWLALQYFVEDATFETATIGGKQIRPLVRWGRLIGAGDPEPATRAELSATATARTLSGVVPAKTKLQNETTGVLYETIVEVPVDAATITLNFRAISDQSGGNGSGSIGNLGAGDTVSFVSPLTNVGTDCTVVAVTTAGQDAETETDYRRRIIQKFQRRPQGGAYADYRDWALEVEGIVNVYPYAANTPGQVDVYCEASTDVDPDGIPTSPMLDAVLVSINQDEGGLANRRPTNAKVTPRAITRQAFDFVISGLDPSSEALKAEISDGLSEHLRSREPYIEGLSVLPRLDRVTLAGTSGIVDQIVAANGATIVTMTQTPGPAYTLEHGEKAKLGTIDWVS